MEYEENTWDANLCADFQLKQRRESATTNKKRRMSRWGLKWWMNLGNVVTILISTALLVDAQTLDKIPQYQDLEAALTSSRCSVREELIAIRQLHSTLPPDAMLLPSCVVVRRCGGCCPSDSLACMPTSIYVTQIQISQQIASRRSFSFITLNFTHHQSCLCQSPESSSCVPRICPAGHEWNLASCQCERVCVPTSCAIKQVWNPVKCRCECQPCHPHKEARTRFLQDEVTCLCMCRHSPHSRPKCKRRLRFSMTHCACVPLRYFRSSVGTRRSRSLMRSRDDQFRDLVP